MSWIDGTGAGLPEGTLAWVQHPEHGVVWAELGYYTSDDGGRRRPSQHWTWTAYALGDAFHVDDVLRYWLIPKPEAP